MMINRQVIERIQIVLQTDNLLLLNILMSSDGMVQRLGSGDLDNVEHELICDTIENCCFQELLKSLPKDFFESVGSYNDPNLQGERLGLSILVIVGGQEYCFQIVYGSKSEGPPDDVVSFVTTAKRLTESWYQQLKDCET